MQTVVVILPYDEDQKAKAVGVEGPFSLHLDPQSLAMSLRERYGNNHHWQLRGKKSIKWDKVIPNIKEVSSSVEGREVNEGVLLAFEMILKAIILHETKANLGEATLT